MISLYSHKEEEVLQTPLLLFDIALSDGTVFYWSTHAVTFGAVYYEPRIVNHGAFHLHLDTDIVYPSSATLSLVIGNADGYLDSRLDPKEWKGASIKARFLFFDLTNSSAGEDSKVLFAGACHCIDEITDTTLKLSFHNKFGVRRTYIPSTPLQARCPWEFPTTQKQRELALTGGVMGQYSPLYRCGYSADREGGQGNLDSGSPFATCGYTRSECQARGMLEQDSSGTVTRRFGGIGNASADPAGARKGGISSAVIPLVYGTGWVNAPVFRTVTEGNFVRVYAVLGHGPISGVLRVSVNQYEIPSKQLGSDLEATGWYTMVSNGQRTGEVDPDSTYSSLIGPLGSVAYLRVSVPSSLVAANGEIKVDALVEGLCLPRYDTDGASLGSSFTSNPVWVYLDLLRRAGWSLADIDLASFGESALKCEGLIDVPSGDGRSLSITRRSCNLVLEDPRSVNEIVRGISVASGLYLRHSPDGKLGIGLEGTLVSQHSALPLGSNCRSPIGGGYPAYEFGDGTNGFGGIARRANGQPSFRRWSNPSAELANKAWTEYIDEFSSFRRTTMALSEVDDILATGQELAVSLKAAGLSNYAHAFLATRTFLRKNVYGNVFVEFESSVRAVNLHPGDLITVTYPKFGLSRSLFRILRMTVGLNSSTIKLLAQFHSDDWYDDSGLSIQTQLPAASANNRVPRPIIGTVLRGGASEFAVEEQVYEGEGASGILGVAHFLHPDNDILSSSDTPGFTVESYFHAAGDLQPGTYYYAVCGIDSEGRSTRLSPVERVTLPDGGSLNAARVINVTADEFIVSLAVFRGSDPWRLHLIQSSVPTTGYFVDTGYLPQAQVPPDEYYDHANFYWREELVGSTQVAIASQNMIGNSGMTLVPDSLVGRTVRIVAGRGAEQERTVAGNTATALTISTPWTTIPDTTSAFCVADANWRLCCSARTSPARFELSNRPGLTIQITGRSANASDVESAAMLAPLTRHILVGASASSVDTAPPSAPFYGLALTGRGTISLVGLSFPTLNNTHTVASAQLMLHYWNELESPSLTTLAASVDANATTVAFSSPQLLGIGRLVQIGREIVRLENRVGAGNEFEVTRSMFDTDIDSFAVGQQCFVLESRPVVVPLQPTMFGTEQGANFSYPSYLPDVRVVASSLFARNSKGNSPVSSQAFTSLTSFGLRTLSGGQYSIQYPGFLAIEDSVSPPLVVEAAHAVGDISAILGEAPTGEAVVLLVRLDGEPYCSLTIPPGCTDSNVVDGLLLRPLSEGAILTLDIVSLGTAANDHPGKDLTVTIRL
jgi:hypothetical protein